MIDSAKIMYPKGSNDECYTPDYGVIPILKYIPKNFVVWCPFDKEDSEFVRLLRTRGNKVISSHIDNGEDFYNFEPQEHWDCIVSNPPFTNKKLIFERAISFEKPFALLMSLTWLNDSAPKKLFLDTDLELLMFDKRIKFLNEGITSDKITFSSAYYCWNLLPKQLIMEELFGDHQEKAETKITPAQYKII